MNRLAASVAGVALLLSTGCMSDGGWSLSKSLGWDEEPQFDLKKPPKASLPVAERVETLGRKIVAQNTFTGIEPMFYTIGLPDPMLFHRGTEELFISEGLVAKCKTEAELAAVLCTELGQMVAEKRAAKNLGRDVDPLRGADHGAGPVMGGGTPVDPGRQAELALHEKRYPRANARNTEIDAERIGRDLLTGAGYEAREFDHMAPVVRQSDRGEKIRKQLISSGDAPSWKK